MKKLSGILIIDLLLVTALANNTSCTKDALNYENQDLCEMINVNSDGVSTVSGTNLEMIISDDLNFNEEELKILAFMKEEEKLAGDVYSYLYSIWGTKIFNNISQAEDTHVDAIRYLLNNYDELANAVGDEGVFTNPDLQDLYNSLIEKGSLSLEEAFKTGALIEELDIKDLTEMSEKVSNENIKIVFENLIRGSENHLRAFNNQLVRSGSEYMPQYLTREEYDTIVNTAIEKGKMYQNRGYGKLRNGRSGR